jgi:hypothetical protein
MDKHTTARRNVYGERTRKDLKRLCMFLFLGVDKNPPRPVGFYCYFGGYRLGKKKKKTQPVLLV